MKKTIAVTPKKRGRPATGRDPLLTLRTPQDIRDALDAYAETLGETVSRSAAIRAILADWLRTHGFLAGDAPKPTGPASDAVEAMETAIKEHRQSKPAARTGATLKKK